MPSGIYVATRLHLGPGGSTSAHRVGSWDDRHPTSRTPSPATVKTVHENEMPKKKKWVPFLFFVWRVIRPGFGEKAAVCCTRVRKKKGKKKKRNWNVSENFQYILRSFFFPRLLRLWLWMDHTGDKKKTALVLPGGGFHALRPTYQKQGVSVVHLCL